MSWSVNEVENVFLSIALIFHLDGMALDGDTAFALQIHVIKHLPFCDLNGMSFFQQTICQSTFTMVNMSDDTEITDVFHGRKDSKRLSFRQRICPNFANRFIKNPM